MITAVKLVPVIKLELYGSVLQEQGKWAQTAENKMSMYKERKSTFQYPGT